MASDKERRKVADNMRELAACRKEFDGCLIAQIIGANFIDDSECWNRLADFIDRREAEFGSDAADLISANLDAVNNDTNAVAQVLGCTSRMVAKLCESGQLRSFRIGNRYRITRNAVLEYVGMK